MYQLYKFILLFIIFFYCLEVNGTSIAKGIVIDNEKIKKIKKFTTDKNGKIYNLQLIESKVSGEHQLVVLKEQSISYIYLKSAKNNKLINTKINNGKRVYFGMSPELVNIDNDGTYEIMKGGGGFGDVGLLDHDGNQLWVFKPNIRVPTKLISADLNSDDIVEFYAINSSSLYQLNHKGKVIWEARAPRGVIFRSDFTDIEVLVDNDTGIKELLLSANNELYRYNFAGVLVNKIATTLEINHFQIVEFNHKKLIFSGYYNDDVALFNLDGTLHKKITLENFPLYHAPQIASIKFQKDKAEYLAILSHSRSATALTQLSIVSSNYDVVYQEIISSVRGMQVIDSDDNDGEVLIIGDRGKNIFEYSMK